MAGTPRNRVKLTKLGQSQNVLCKIIAFKSEKNGKQNVNKIINAL